MDRPPEPIRLLIVEDNPNDAELMLRELRHAGLEPDWKRVEMEADFVAHLTQKPDLILSDYAMPQFSGLRALELLRESGKEIPFILVSATIGEETAVGAMRQGAADYLLKDRLTRLGEAAKQALAAKRIREERKQSENRLRELADIVHRAQDAIIASDFETDRVTTWNSGAERLYGWSESEAIGHPMGELIFGDSGGRAALLEQLVATGEFHGEIKHRTKDGREVIVDSRASLIRNDDGTPRSVLGINTDITEQKKLETQLLRAQRLESIGTLASGVAHDLNNVLAPILMGAEILRGATVREDAASVLDLIEQSARRGSAIVKQVLTFARGIEGEHVSIQPSYLVQEMCDIAQRTFPKSIQIRSQYAEDLWSLQGDPTQLHQVLLNLAVNARDAMPNGGLLTIGVENFQIDEQYASLTPGAKAGPHAMFRVSDTGEGIPRSVLDKIFDPFFTTKEIGKGTGLGLSTSLGIVKSHGGFISVYSELRSGTTFKIFLPAQPTEQTAIQSDMSFESLKGNGESILVVDDDPAVLALTKVLLEKHNYLVVTANDAPEALALFAQQMASMTALLTDIMMPYMDGIALIRAVQRMKPRLKFIASTGQGEETRAAELQSLGVTNFLTKPYDTEKLLKAVHEALTEPPGEAPSSI